jgi:histidyl-tRNA synthetase
LAGGGRYDGLVHEIGGPQTPAIGFALGVERTIEAMRATEQKEVAPGLKKPYLFVVAQGERAAAQAFAWLQLWRCDIRVEGGFFDKKLGAQISLADRLGATHCAILGDDEMAQGVITLRDMKTGEQKRVPPSELLQSLA